MLWICSRVLLASIPLNLSETTRLGVGNSVEIVVEKSSRNHDKKRKQNCDFEATGFSVRLEVKVNNKLTGLLGPPAHLSSPRLGIVTVPWNLHRFAAGRWLSVTSIGICLLR